MIKIQSISEDKQFRICLPDEIASERDAPIISIETFIDILIRRSRNKNITGGKYVNDYFIKQIDPEYGDAILLFLSPFDEWANVISQFE